MVKTIHLFHPEDDKYKLIETSSMSGRFSGPPSLSQERIHGVTAKRLLQIENCYVNYNEENLSKKYQIAHHPQNLG